MTRLSLENIEFIKILATSDATILQAGMNDATRSKLNDEIGTILREYYREHTMGLQTGWTQKLLDVGIDEDTGKSAIACARRLGLDIS
ncbi:hypothetical protein [Nitrosopumilus sp.]|uniref:hypothetical protein n=1 Tax=Nitrosopumilus sp. TaxID=2024843 RepID=UPI00247CD34D|nr:hypothetical protein [Nitrosopumilus sp.]